MKESVVVIACAMLEDEVHTAMARCGKEYPIHWLERGLHEFPQRLHQALQEQIAAHQDADTILLSYGLCGNALAEISSPGTRLVLPRFHDCIHMLTSHCPGSTGAIEADRLYLTAGWLQGERTLAHQYRAAQEKYGPDRARWVFKQMLGGYRGCCLLDTGAYPLDAATAQTAALAQLLELPLETAPATLRILEKLFNGVWDEEFIILDPGQPLDPMCFYGAPACPRPAQQNG